LAITLLVGAVFFQVMAQFSGAVVLAALPVVFQPAPPLAVGALADEPARTCGNHNRADRARRAFAASWLGWKAFTECHESYHVCSTAKKPPARATTNATGADQPDPHGAARPTYGANESALELRQGDVRARINATDLVGNTTSVIGWFGE